MIFGVASSVSWRIAADTPLFLPLCARLVAVIGASVADEALFAAKRIILAAPRFTARRFADRFSGAA